MLVAVLVLGIDTAIPTELTTNDGLWRVNYQLKTAGNAAGPFKANQLYGAQVHIQANDRSGYQCPESLGFDAEMPAHYHGMTTRAKVTRLSGADCRFDISGILFQMGGEWRLHFDLRNGRMLTRASDDVKVDP